LVGLCLAACCLKYLGRNTALSHNANGWAAAGPPTLGVCVPTSSQKLIARNRAPRVTIEYAGELYGAQRRVQLPFVIGVLADLSGHPAEPMRPLAERKFTEMDADTFDAFMAVVRPRLALLVPHVQNPPADLALDIVFECLADFEPGALSARIPTLQPIVERRGQLANLLSYADGKTGAEDLLVRVLRDRALLRALAEPIATDQLGSDTTDATHSMLALGDGTRLVDAVQREFRLRSGDATLALVSAMRTMAREALCGAAAPQPDAVTFIEQLVASLDEQLTLQLRLVLHHPAFQLLEGAWRGLHHLAVNSETSETLKIRVLNVSKAELAKTLKRYKGTAWDQSPLFKRIYESEFGSFGGEPFGCLIGDYLFDHSIADTETLGELAQICAAAHAPFIAGAALSFANVGMGQGAFSFGRTVVGQLVAPEFAAWRSLQHAEEARYIALAMPRFLARLPWGRATRSVPEFGFEEVATLGALGEHVWCNAAYVMAVCIARSQATYGWCARIRGIESGGAVEGLPVYRAKTATGEPCTTGPVELAINDRAEAELSRAGFLALIHRQGADFAAFCSAPSIHQYGSYDDPTGNAAARLGSSLPYLLACCRFAQYLKCMVRDQVGSFRGPEAMERGLQQWIADYVDPNHTQSSEAMRARRPLGSAEIQVSEVEGNPGYYAVRLYLMPVYQLEGLPKSIRIVTRLTSAKAAQ